MSSPSSNKRKRSSEPEEAPSRVTLATNAPTTTTEQQTSPSDQPPLPNEAPPADDASEDGEVSEGENLPQPTSQQQPPLPSEDAPPLPSEPVPQQPSSDDDGWQPIWDDTAQAYYFYNRFTQASQWENPRLLNTAASHMPTHHDRIGNIMAATASDPVELSIKPAALGGYNPAIHGDYDPNADYAQLPSSGAPAHHSSTLPSSDAPSSVDPTDSSAYAATAGFNRFTGRFQADLNASENHNDENKSKRQMNAFFDVDAAANSHDGRSLRAERQSKKLTKEEVKAFREKTKKKKEEKRRAWLKD